MRRQRPGKLRLIDAMSLIGATALGLTAARVFIDVTGSRGTLAQDVAKGSVMLALVLSVALVAIRLGGTGRAGRRRLYRQPGFAAAAAAAATLPGSALIYLMYLHHWSRVENLRERLVDAYWLFSMFDGQVCLSAPHAVAAAWLILALSGRWRWERSGLDRLGLVLGIYWASVPFHEDLVQLFR